MIGDVARDILQKIVTGRGSEIRAEDITEFVEWLNAAQGSMNSIFDGRDKIVTLSEISQDSGDIVNGRFIAPSPDATSYEPSDPGFTGSFMSGQGETFANIASMTFNAGAVAAGDLQVGYNTSGQLVAGAGAVLVDNLGVRLIGGDSETIDNTKSIAWIDTVGNYISRIFSYVYSLGAVVIGGTTISVEPPNANVSNFLVEVIDNLAKKVAFMITCGTGAAITINWYGVDVDTVIKGDTTDVLTVDAGLEAVGIGGAAESGYPLKINGNGKITGFLNIPSSGELTIAGGVVTATGSRHTIDTQGDAATDDLDTINGGTEGDILILSSANAGRDPTLKDGTGNLILAGDFTLTAITDTITLVRYAATWVELSRSDNT